MTTTAFTLDNAAITPMTVASDQSLVGRTSRSYEGKKGYDVDFTGTGANQWIYYQTGLTAYKILDGTPSQVDLTGLVNNAWNSVTLATGLTDAKHTLYFEANYLDVGTGSAGTGLEITGASPAISLRTGFGTNIYRPAADTAKFQKEGSAVTAAIGFPTFNVWTTASSLNLKHGRLRFNVSAGTTDIWIAAYRSSSGLPAGSPFVVAIDGVDQPSQAFDAVSVAGPPDTYWVHAVTGLDGAAHEIMLTGRYLYIAAIMSVGGTISGTAPTAQPIWCFFGDSITESVYAAVSNSPMNGFPYHVGLGLGVCPYNLGLSGRSVTTEAGGTDPGEGTTAINKVTATGAAAVVCLLGTNDFGAYVAGTLTSAEFRAAYGTMLAGWVSGLGAIPIHCFMPTPTGNMDSHPTQRAAMFVDIQTAVSASGGAQAKSYGTDGWIVVASDTIDTIHPTTAGFVKVTTEMLADLNAVAGTISLLSKTTTTVNLSATAPSPSGGTYTYQWYRSTSSGFTPGAGNILSGKTSLTLADSGLTPGTAYYYVLAYTDADGTVVYATEFAVTTSSNASSGMGSRRGHQLLRP